LAYHAAAYLQTIFYKLSEQTECCWQGATTFRRTTLRRMTAEWESVD